MSYQFASRIVRVFVGFESWAGKQQSPTAQRAKLAKEPDTPDTCCYGESQKPESVTENMYSFFKTLTKEKFLAGVPTVCSGLKCLLSQRHVSGKILDAGLTYIPMATTNPVRRKQWVQTWNSINGR
ncbi:Hypp282 [Branchiostoma lanceolatum]|uniref:Hypp282 protein n=1 Tax=Branchiostoma lanceolatum TaxID=7740 RepID=A0A8J9WCK8_BRALA|nr:Hypp282 [Branchiostoma lanceolatum]